jgi:hypothetical protein
MGFYPYGVFMKKYCLHIALLALTAFFVFLAACGGDEPENLDGNGWLKIQVAIDDLVKDNGPIVKCDESWTEHCPTYYDDPSSSSNNDGDGDGDGDDGTSSSSKPNEYSSQSGGGGDTSSADNTTITAVGDNCKTLTTEEQERIKGYFTCNWDPASVKAGNNAKIIMNINSAGKAAGCEAGQASRQIGTGFKKGLAYFPVNTPMKTSGIYDDIDKDGQGLTNPSDKEWPPSGDFIVNGLLSCDGNGCSKPCTALNIMEAGKPIASYTKELSCPWVKLPVGTNNLSKGSTTDECELAGTITNNTDDNLGCENNGALTKANIRYCGGAIGGSPSDCNGKTGEIKVEAVAKCLGGNAVVKTLTYNIVNDPSLDGECTWSKNPTSLAQGAKPSGVSLKDSYGRCGSLSDGALPITAYGNSKVSEWPTNGILPNDTYVGTYSDVKTTVNCTPAVTQASCPSLTVNKGCSVVIDAFNVAKSVPNGDCFDVKYNAPAGMSNTANGLHVQCITSNLGVSNCDRQLQYPATGQSSTKAGSCGDSETQNPDNTLTGFTVTGSSNFGTSGKNFDLEGITINVYSNPPEDYNYQCLGNTWQPGAVWTGPPYCDPAGQAIPTLKPGVSLKPLEGATIKCKVKSGGANNWN